MALAAGLAVLVAIGSPACGRGSSGDRVRAEFSPRLAPSAAGSRLAAPTRFPDDWPFVQGQPSPHSARAMVTTDAALATRVGVQMLETGGNAIDAAVATAFALAVVFPTAGNIGGGGFLIARMSGKSYALDFRETAPAAATRDMYVGPDGKLLPDSREGFRSAGVPGSVAGLWEAWHSLGSKRKTWRDVLAPAIELADHGFVADEPFVKTISLVRSRLAQYPASSALFLPGGGLPVPGTAWRDPDLAAVLRRIADEGPPGFYDGVVAELIAGAMKAAGGLVTRADLQAYRAKWRAPIDFEYRGRHAVGMPPPSSGGVTMAMMAHILEGRDLRATGWHSAPSVHVMAEAMRRAFAARNAKLGDPDFVKNPVEELLSEAWASRQRATIRADRATPTAELFPRPTPAGGDGPHTTHLGVVDPEGNAVALTTTLNAWFGSGATVPGAGFLLNDEMDDFASIPGTANMFGLVQGEPNAIAGGKRMLSSMSPTIVLGASGDVELVLGAAGGSRIITTVFEELSNAVDFGMNASDAVRAPRFHQQDTPDILFLEPRSLPDDVRRALEQLGHVTKEVEHIADAPAIGRDRGLWQGAAEPRRDGSFALGL